MPFGIGFWEILLLLLILFAFSIPAYIVGTKSGVSDSWLAFIPIAGPFIVLLRVAQASAWWALLLLLLQIGAVILGVWTAVFVPSSNRRSRWWTLPLIIPGVSVIGWWVYAFTLEQPQLTQSPAPDLVPPT